MFQVIHEMMMLFTRCFVISTTIVVVEFKKILYGTFIFEVIIDLETVLGYCLVEARS